MKKLIIASTALVASAGFAAAEMSLSGEANMGVKYDSGLATKETRVYNEIDFSVKGTGTTDAGLEFGASLDLDSRYRNGAANDQFNAADPEVYVSGDFGTLTIGDVSVADDAMTGFLADVGFDGVGVDNIVENLTGENTGADADVEYKGSFGDLELIATFHDMDEDYALAVMYTFGDVTVGASYSFEETGAVDTEVVSLAVKADLGMAEVAAIYLENDFGAGADVTAWGVSAKFDAGAADVIVSIADTDVAGIDASYGIGFEYGLGGGATLAGGIAKIDRGAAADTVADLGVKMKF